MNLEPLRELARDRLTGRTVIAITSGKGGVGESTIASLMALIMSRYGRTTLVDLDIHGTSIPRAMGFRAGFMRLVRRGLNQ
jgi:Mrp family chromosome partitioning ATPase